MKTSKLTILVSLLALSIPGTYYVFRTFDNQAINQHADPDLSMEIKTLKSEINALKKTNSEMNELKLAIAQLKRKKEGDSKQIQNHTQTTDNPLDEAQAMPKNPIEMGKKQEEQQAKSFENMNNAFLAEASDPNWSPETTSLVTSFFESDTAKDIDLSDIQCRKTLCKIEINKHNTSEVNNNLMLNFPMHVAKALSQTSVFNQQNDDGTTHMTMFMARNGFELPATF